MKRILGILFVLSVLSSAYDSVVKLKMACDIGNERACKQLYALDNHKTIKTNSSKLSVISTPNYLPSSKNKIQNTKKIIATGYGLNKEQALNNAFKTAIEQYVGVVVSSDVMMKNGKLIKDKILTASNGFVKTYKELSTSNDNGLFEVNIEAVVKSQKVFRKIKSLHIPILTIYNAEYAVARMTKKPVSLEPEANSIATRMTKEPVSVSTMNKSKADVENIMRKTLGDFFNSKSIKEMLMAEVTSMKIDEDKAVGGKVPVKIKYTLSVNNRIYTQKIEQIETVFRNLGGEYHSRVDLPKKSNSGPFVIYCATNKNSIKKLKANSLGILKRYGKDYKLDVWEFPAVWIDIYPFYIDSSIQLKKKLQMILVFKDKNHKVVMARNIKPTTSGDNGYEFKILLANINRRGYCYDSYEGQENYVKVIVPMIMEALSVGTVFFSEIDCQNTQIIDIEDIKKIKYVTVEMDEIWTD